VPLNRIWPLAFVLACSGADGSSLLSAQDASLPIEDATTPDDAVADDAEAPPDVSLPDAISTKDAAPKDAGNPYVDPGIACGNAECDPTKNLCCGSITSYYPQYTYAFACEPLSDLVQCAAGLGIYCDSDHDCASGVCCGDLDSQNHYAKVSCKPTCTGYVWPYTEVHFCDPKAPKCDTNQKCAASTALSGYYVCQ
jgi:hypothetical protein